MKCKFIINKIKWGESTSKTYCNVLSDSFRKHYGWEECDGNIKNCFEKEEVRRKLQKKV